MQFVFVHDATPLNDIELTDFRKGFKQKKANEVGLTNESNKRNTQDITCGIAGYTPTHYGLAGGKHDDSYVFQQLRYAQQFVRE